MKYSDTFYILFPEKESKYSKICFCVIETLQVPKFKNPFIKSCALLFLKCSMDNNLIMWPIF